MKFDKTLFLTGYKTIKLHIIKIDVMSIRKLSDLHFEESNSRNRLQKSLPTSEALISFYSQ